MTHQTNNSDLFRERGENCDDMWNEGRGRGQCDYSNEIPRIKNHQNFLIENIHLNHSLVRPL